MARLWTLALKDLRILWRDKLNFIWMFGIPLVFALFFGSIMGGMGPSKANPLRVSVIDEGLQAPAAQEFLDRLRQSESIKVDVMQREAALDAVRRGRRVAYLGVKTAGDDGNPFLGSPIPDIEIGIDPSRQAEGGILRGLVMEAAFGGIREAFTNPAKALEQIRDARKAIDTNEEIGTVQRVTLTTFFSAFELFMTQVQNDAQLANGRSTFEPSIAFEDVARDRSGQPRSSFEIAFPSSIVWGLLAVVSAFSISIVRERKEGTLLRLVTAPIERTAVLGGKALACFLACAFVILVLLIFSHLVFGVRIASPIGLAMAVACSSACFVGIAVLMSVVGKTEEAVSGISWGVFVLMAMLGGGMVPLVAMPPFMVTLSHASPVKWGVLSLEGAIWRDFNLAEMLPGCGMLLAFGLVTFVIGARVLARREI